MKLLPLPRSKVKLGAALPWNVRDKNALLLLSRGHIVVDEHQLEGLLQRGAFVDEEEVKAAHLHIAIAGDAPRTKPISLFSLWDQTTTDMVKLMAKAPHMPDLALRVTDFSRALIKLIDQDMDIALYRTVRHKATAFYYGYDHSIHTALLCVLIGRHLEWQPARVESLVKAAITMNMPILALQGKMADQEDPIKDAQRAQIRKHPQEACDWLVANGVSDPDWLDAVANHHERADGTGYPQGLTSVSDGACALRAADVFMARITPRVLHPAVSIKEAARLLFTEDHGGAIAGAVIKEFGIYPPGELVKLASGETAVVMRRANNAKNPVVAAITDETGCPTVKTLHHETAHPGHAIVSIVADKAMVARMPPERIYGYAVAAL